MGKMRKTNKMITLMIAAILVFHETLQVSAFVAHTEELSVDDRFISRDDVSFHRVNNAGDLSASPPLTSTSTDSSRVKRSAIFEDSKLWPKAEIPYLISKDIDSNIRTAIHQSIEHIQNMTCLRFIPKTEEQLERDRLAAGKDINHVEFMKHANLCASHVGMLGNGRQMLNLSDICASIDDIIHEIGHLIGLWHEQSRIDRDAHIHIKWNQMALRFAGNFKKPHEMKWLGPYDFASIMHYHHKMFTDRGLNVFETIKDLNIDIGHKRALSFYDAMKINKLYACADKCGKNSPKCENGGYLNRFCKCVCPKSLTGSRCHQTANQAKCGGVIDLKTGKMSIKSPNYPHPYPPNIKCTWLIKAAIGFQVFLTVEDYDLACNDTLEIRQHYIGIEQRPRTCEARTKFDERSFTSTGNRLLLDFASDEFGEGTGFLAAIKATPSSNCASNPCKNNATCQDIEEIETYFCKCEDGWAGQNCDIPMRDGQWMDWSAWSGCFAECGRERRHRSCEGPLNSGFDCEGVSVETRSCGHNLTKCEGLFRCDFGWEPSPRSCGIVQNITKDDFDWRLRHFKGDATRDQWGHTDGSREDSFFVMEGNEGRRYEKAAFTLPELPVSTGRYCLQFYQHMSSRDAGMLRVIRQTRKSSRVIWQASGRHNPGWHRTNVNVLLHDGVKIHFEGTRGDGADCDIAIDDISFSPLGCFINDTGLKVLRRNPRIHRRIHACYNGTRRIAIGTNTTHIEKCAIHDCYCNLDGKLDCMVINQDRCTRDT